MHCSHTPSRYRTALGRFFDFFSNGDTLNAEDDRVTCARCETLLLHPEMCMSTSIQLWCLAGAMATGLLLYWLKDVLHAAGWSAGALGTALIVLALLLPWLLERVMMSAVLAICPWRALKCDPADRELHLNASALEREILRKRRRDTRGVYALEVCNLMMLGVLGGKFLLLEGALLLAIALIFRREKRPLLLAVSLLAAGALTTFIPMPEWTMLLLNVLALTAMHAVMLLDEIV